MPSAGTAYVDILPNTSKFASALQTGVSGSLQSVGGKLSALGASMTRNITRPLALAGGVAVKMALDFDKAFTQIAAVSNASQKDIERWRKQVMTLSGRTAQAPKDLAEALFFLASAGLKTNQIMPTLEASAKAGAAGLGSIADISKIAANAVNAYADSNLTAKQALDTLVAAVREGSAEPDEFAGALGRILPIAAKAGVEFDNVTASLAALSNIGLDVNEGTTAMRGLLQALIAPGSQAGDALKKIGISANEMRAVISEQGILGALRLLEERTGGSIDKLRDIIPNVRALTGAFGLTGQEAEKVNAIFKRVTDSTGSLGEAFRTTAESDAFKFQKRVNDLKLTAISLGQDLLPIVTKGIGIIGNLVGKFRDLSPAMQENVIKWGLIAMAAGPVLRIVGALTTGLGKLAGGLTGLVRGTSTLGGLLSPGGLILGGLAVLGVAWWDGTRRAREFEQSVHDLATALVEGTKTTRSWAAETEQLVSDLSGLTSENKRTELALSDVGNALTSVTRGLSAADFAAVVYADNQERLSKAQREAENTILAYMKRVDLLPGALTEANKGYVGALLNAGRYSDALLFLKTHEDRVSEAMSRRGERTERLGHETERLTAASDRFVAGLRDQIREQRRVDANMDALETSTRGYTTALEDVPGRVRTRFEGLGLKALLSSTAALREQAGDTEGPWTVQFRSLGLDAVQNSVAALREQASRPIVFTIATRGRVHEGGYIFHRGGQVLHGGGLSGDEVPAILQRGEFVLRKEAVRNIGVGALQALNQGHATVGNEGDGGKPWKALLREIRRFADKIIGEYDRLLSQAEEKLGDKLPDAYREAAEKWRKELDKLNREFDRASDKLERRMDAVREKMDEVSSAVASGFSSLTDIVGMDFGEAAPNLADILKNLQAGFADAQKFADIIRQLAAQGLDKSILLQLLQAGPAAIGTAEAILGGGTASVNAWVASIAALQQDLADELNLQFFGEEMSSLEAELAALRKEYREETRALIRAIKEMTAKLGNVTGAQHGFHGTVRGPRMFYVEPGITERVDIGPAGSGGVSVAVNVYGSVTVDDFRREVMEAVEDATRRR